MCVPDAAHEALRDLVRAREAAKRDQHRARQRLGKFLLLHGIRRPDTMKTAWSKPHLEWIKMKVHFDLPTLEVTLIDYVHEVEHVAQRFLYLYLYLLLQLLGRSMADTIHLARTKSGEAGAGHSSCQKRMGARTRLRASKKVMRSFSVPILTLILMNSFALARDGVQTAKVLAVKAHESGRIAYWEGRVAIYDGYPFYDIKLSLGQKKYVVRYESLTGFYPSSWKVGREIQVRMAGKGQLYLINGAEEVLAGIYNARAQDCVLATGQSAVRGAGPQVPCD